MDTGPTNRGPTSLLALKIRTPVANTGKLRSIGQMPVKLNTDLLTIHMFISGNNYFTHARATVKKLIVVKLFVNRKTAVTMEEVSSNQSIKI